VGEKNRAVQTPMGVLGNPELGGDVLPLAAIHRSAWKEDSRNFTLSSFSEVYIPALCVAPSLCGGDSSVENEGL
jgi:hypothetical protein